MCEEKNFIFLKNFFCWFLQVSPKSPVRRDCSYFSKQVYPCMRSIAESKTHHPKMVKKLIPRQNQFQFFHLFSHPAKAAATQKTPPCRFAGKLMLSQIFSVLWSYIF